ncbi:MAG: hypothetical protein WCD70_14670 [Alphaproteobacteria bacterium]
MTSLFCKSKDNRLKAPAPGGDNDIFVTGSFFVRPSSASDVFVRNSECSFIVPNISFEEYAKAVTASTDGVIDLRPIQKANAAKASPQPA